MSRKINEQALQDIVKLSRAACLSYGGKGPVSEHLNRIDKLQPLVEAAWTDDAPAACRGWIAEIDYDVTAIRMRLRELADRPDHEVDLTRSFEHIRYAATRMCVEALDYMAGI